MRNMQLVAASLPFVRLPRANLRASPSPPRTDLLTHNRSIYTAFPTPDLILTPNDSYPLLTPHCSPHATLPRLLPPSLLPRAAVPASRPPPLPSPPMA